jgi:hypothetical protein
MEPGGAWRSQGGASRIEHGRAGAHDGLRMNDMGGQRHDHRLLPLGFSMVPAITYIVCMRGGCNLYDDDGNDDLLECMCACTTLACS